MHIHNSTSQVRSRCDLIMKIFFNGALPETVEEIDHLAEALRSITDKGRPHTVIERFRGSISSLKAIIDNPENLLRNPDDQRMFRSLALDKIVAKIAELSVLNPVAKETYIAAERDRIRAEAELQRKLIEAIPANGLTIPLNDSQTILNFMHQLNFPGPQSNEYDVEVQYELDDETQQPLKPGFQEKKA